MLFYGQWTEGLSNPNDPILHPRPTQDKTRYLNQFTNTLELKHLST